MVLDFGGTALFGRGGEFFESQEEQSIRSKFIVKLNTQTISGISFGNGVNTGGTNRQVNANQNFGTWFVYSGTAGSVYSIQAYMTFNNAREQYGIWNFTPGSELLAVTGSALGAIPSWVEQTFDASVVPVIQPGSYVLGMNGAANGSAYSIAATNESADMVDSFPITVTSWQNGAADFTNDWRFAIYAILIPTDVTDNELYFILEPNSYYTFTANINAVSTSTRPDMDIWFTVPSGATAKYWTTGDPMDVSTHTTVALTTTPSWTYVNGYVNTGNTKGNLTLNWKMNTPSAASDSTTLLSGTWMSLSKQA